MLSLWLDFGAKAYEWEKGIISSVKTVYILFSHIIMLHHKCLDIVLSAMVKTLKD